MNEAKNSVEALEILKDSYHSPRDTQLFTIIEETFKILKNKQVDIHRLKESSTEKEYNDGIIASYGYSLGCNLLLASSDFDLVKEWLKK